MFRIQNIDLSNKTKMIVVSKSHPSFNYKYWYLTIWNLGVYLAVDKFMFNCYLSNVIY